MISASYMYGKTLEKIVTQRRTHDRERVYTCDPLGELALSGSLINCNEVLWDVHARLPEASKKTKSVSVARGASIMSVASKLGLTPCFQDRIDILVDSLERDVYVHFRSMAGDGITFVGKEEEEGLALIVETYSGFGTNLWSTKDRGTITARATIEYFAQRASPKECELFLQILLNRGKCVFEDREYGDKFLLDFGDDREERSWQRVVAALDRDPGPHRDGAFDRLWTEVKESFTDPDGRFRRLLNALESLNRVVCVDDLLFSHIPRCQAFLKDAKSRLMKEQRKLVSAINREQLDEIENEFSLIHNQLYLIYHEEHEIWKQKLEAWLNDPTVNPHGVSRGAINRCRYEMSVYNSEGIDRALAIRASVIERDKGICQHCGREELTAEQLTHTRRALLPYAQRFHIDHIVPLSRGGTNDLDNLQLLCPNCNLRKGVKVESEMPAEVTRAFYKNRLRQ